MITKREIDHHEMVTYFIRQLLTMGGCSLDMESGAQPTTGYMVSVGKEWKFSIMGHNTVDEFTNVFRSELAKHAHYLGGWEFEGEYYLDVSKNVMDLHEALMVAAKNHQTAIYDLNTGEEVML